jgi:phosphoribosylformimino-5-aminoimidazole carboxamide ribotide isomerase
MHIWPAIDILEGKCVRLVQGDYDRKTIYGRDPADMAARWIGDGATCLHLVDLDGARDGSNINRAAVAEIVGSFKVECQLGGGIRDEETINDYLELGVQRLVIGTKALKDPKWLIEMCKKYPGKLVVGLDARNGRVATDGWLEVSDRPATDVAKEMSDQPIAGIVYTDISRDGMLAGPNLESFAQIIAAADVPVIASGGVTTVQDVSELAALGADGCIIGKSLYEGKLTLADAMRAAGRAPAQR